MEPEEKIFFIHVVAGRAINSEVHEQGQRYAKKLNDQAAAKGKLTPLEQRIVDGAVDTGASNVLDACKSIAPSACPSSLYGSAHHY